MMKKIQLLAPCPSYDVARMQAWLEDLAQDGWFLMKQGYLLGFWSFEKGTPSQMRYRMVISPEGTKAINDYWGDPSPESLELSSASGWTYLEKYRDFHIYATADKHAPEMETDPELQIKTLDKLRRRFLINSLILLVFYCFQIAKLSRILSGEALYILLQVSFGASLLTLLMLPLIFLYFLFQYLHLRKLRRNYEESTNKKDWRRHALFHRCKSVAWSLYLVVTIVLWISSLASLNAGTKIPYTSYSGDLPFATMEDILPEAELQFHNTRGGSSVAFDQHFLAPQMITLFQNGTTTLPDKAFFRAQLHIKYYEMRNDWLAQELAREFLSREGDVYDAPYVMLDLPYTGADLTLAYTKDGTHVLILADGSRMIYASLYQDGTYELPPEEWMPLFAQGFLQGAGIEVKSR